MKNEFILWRIYKSADFAIPIIDLLEANEIPFEFVPSETRYDIANFSGTPEPEFTLKLRQEDFTRVDQLLLDNAEKNLSNDEDHYLNTFSNEELSEIILKPDEWSSHDYLLARKILENRGKYLDEDLLNSLRKQRLEDLARPEPSQRSWIAAGYLFSIVGGFLGLFIGLHLWRSKKTLPDGTQVFSFSEKDRVQGKRIFFVGLSFTCLWVVVRFLTVLSS